MSGRLPGKEAENRRVILDSGVMDGRVDLAAEGRNTMFSAERLRLDVADAGGEPAQERIPLDWPDLPGRSWQLTDILGQNVFERDGGELASPGLFVNLGPLQFHLLVLQ